MLLSISSGPPDVVLCHQVFQLVLLWSTPLEYEGGGSGAVLKARTLTWPPSFKETKRSLANIQFCGESP